jgi:hypothetical protein
MSETLTQAFAIGELLASPRLTPIAARLSLAVEMEFRREAKRRGVPAEKLRSTHDVVVTYGDEASALGTFSIQFVDRDPTGELPRVRVILPASATPAV